MVVDWMECIVCWCGFDRMEWWIDNWIEWICMCVDRMCIDNVCLVVVSIVSGCCCDLSNVDDVVWCWIKDDG